MSLIALDLNDFCPAELIEMANTLSATIDDALENGGKWTSLDKAFEEICRYLDIVSGESFRKENVRAHGYQIS